MLKDFFSLTLKGIRHRPTRSWLTIVGIVIGISLVVIIFSLSAGIKSAISSTLQMFGTGMVDVFPGKETNPFTALIGGEKFKEQDLLDLEKIEGVEYVVTEEMGTMTVEFKGEKKSILVHASPWEGVIKMLEMSKGVRLEAGRWPVADDVNEVVLGSKVADGTYKGKVKVGDELIIKNKRLKVVGIMSEIGVQMSDNIIYISMDIYRQLTNLPRVAVDAAVKIKDGYDPNLVAKEIRHELSKQDVVREFGVLTREKEDEIVGDVLTIVELSLIIIALISLVVGAVGIMNTMYTSVLERTRQIGVMKAIGASNDMIMSLFLIESGLIGMVGGILGLIFGVSMAYVIGIIAGELGVRGLFSFAALDYFGFLVILIVTFITGVLAGVLPARQAAKMEPAEALRYE